MPRGDKEETVEGDEIKGVAGSRPGHEGPTAQVRKGAIGVFYLGEL